MMPQKFFDQFDLAVTAEDAATVACWDEAISDYFFFRGNPLESALALADDQAFVMGDVFAAAMLAFDGAAETDAKLAEVLARLRTRRMGVTPRERKHVDAALACARGESTAGAAMWDDLLADYPGDVVAMKLAHEAYFLTGKSQAMRASVRAVLPAWTPEKSGYGLVIGQHAFAMEECGEYAKAEGTARLSLDLNPDDCWALHALVHTYEMQDRHSDCVALLESTCGRWREQVLFSAHIWWHLGLRHIAAGEAGKALALFDEHLATVDPENAFRLTDGSSFLWRMELAGFDVGTRWDLMADKWQHHHTALLNPFLVLHMAMTLCAVGQTQTLEEFLASCAAANERARNEIASNVLDVALPASRAMIAYRNGDDCSVARIMRPLMANLPLLGGSNAQRDILERTLSASLIRSGDLDGARHFLEDILDQRPNSVWVLRDLAKIHAARGEAEFSAVCLRHADLSFRPVQESAHADA